MENFDINVLSDNISFLCKQKGVSVNQLLQDCGLRSSVIDNLKKGSIPSVDKVYAISQYFNVSIEYLITYKNTEK